MVILRVASAPAILIHYILAMAAAEFAHAAWETERARPPISAAHDICRARRKRTSRVTPSLALSAACGAAYGAGVGREMH